MIMSLLAHSIISSISSIMCAMDYMYNNTVGKFHCKYSQCCMSIFMLDGTSTHLFLLSCVLCTSCITLQEVSITAHVPSVV